MMKLSHLQQTMLLLLVLQLSGETDVSLVKEVASTGDSPQSLQGELGAAPVIPGDIIRAIPGDEHGNGKSNDSKIDDKRLMFVKTKF